MKSRYLVAGATALMVVLGACAPKAGSSPSQGGGAGVTLTVAHTSAGDALAGADGKTLYTNTQEHGGNIACTEGCAVAWPPLTGSASAGSGATGTLGTITRPDGSVQVTYNGSPLYYYANDAAAGDVTGQGIGGIWYIAAPSGPGASAPAASAAASTGYHY